MAQNTLKTSTAILWTDAYFGIMEKIISWIFRLGKYYNHNYIGVWLYISTNAKI